MDIIVINVKIKHVDSDYMMNVKPKRIVIDVSENLTLKILILNLDADIEDVYIKREVDDPIPD